MKLPTSMCSGATRQSPPCSSVTPWMRSTFDSIPSICAPRETRKRQRSWTCGSQAALPITVSPSASTAAMTTFSVAITLASSRKIALPRSFGARISKRPLTSISTPSSARPWMCGSSRRRPITSPPGRHDHAAEAREQRAGEQERRADAAAELLVELGLVDAGRVDPDLVLAQPFGVGADVDEQLDHRLHVADPGHVRQLHRLRREHGGGQDRQRAVLVPGGADGAAERASALDHEGFHAGGERSRGHEAGYRRRPMDVTRDRAWETLTTYTKSESLRRHALAVEASTRSYARRFGEDEELWGVVALLHDFDYEIHPTLDQHPQDGA